MQPFWNNGKDFTGGEFVLVEQRPRMQSRAEVVQLGQRDGVIFAVHHRPVQGTRGTYRVNLRHGVSRLRSGRRHTMGFTGDGAGSQIAERHLHGIVGQPGKKPRRGAAQPSSSCHSDAR